jgi:hypothetical protein
MYRSQRPSLLGYSFQELPPPSLALCKQKAPGTVLLFQLLKAGNMTVQMQQRNLSRIFSTLDCKLALASLFTCIIVFKWQEQKTS